MEEVEGIEVEKDEEDVLVLQETTPTVEKKWSRKNICRSIVTAHGQNCMVVINGRSCEKIS